MGRLAAWAAGNAVKYKLGRLVGYVLSNRMSKTVVVSVPWIYKHPKYCLLYTSPSPRDS